MWYGIRKWRIVKGLRAGRKYGFGVYRLYGERNVEEGAGGLVGWEARSIEKHKSLLQAVGTIQYNYVCVNRN